ncbi:MAG: class I mannose-6-phosphate isomerase [Bacteroidales bacterium]|nr:class I mannose-6-phosphate isomerase [Bacteroidales bacterium]
MTNLYPLRFEPIFQTNLWAGRRLPGLFHRPDVTDPIGEAWVLSDVDGHPSRVTNGLLAGQTLRELLTTFGPRLVGPARLPNGRFPVLLKFIDAAQELSVQVHPNDAQARQKRPTGAGKTEAWVILDADPETSRIYAGFRDGVREETFRAALATRTTPDTLHAFSPQRGDCVFLPAGTVHAIGANVLLFEIQQTSDITYRLYDWDRVDAKTGQPRELHIDDGLACSDFTQGPCDPVVPTIVQNDPFRREELVRCEYFQLHRLTTATPLMVGEPGRCRVIVGLEGQGTLSGWGAEPLPIACGDVVLLPAELGAVTFVPTGKAVLLECGLSE